MNNVMATFTKLSASSDIGQANRENTENTTHNSTVSNDTAPNNATSHHEEYTGSSARFSTNGNVHREHTESTAHNSTVTNGAARNNNSEHREVHMSNPARASASHNSPSNYEQRNRPDRMMRNNVHHERPAVAAEQQEEMQLYTPDDIMRIMRLSKSSVYKLFKSGDFPAIKIGSILRVDKQAFERWLRSHTVV